MRLRILTYNIHKGFNTFGNQFVLHEIKQSLRATHADILFLQEVVGENQEHRNSISNWPTEPQFEYLADSVWSHYSYGKNAVFPIRHHGNAILSKFPIEFSENLNISNHKLEQRGLLHCRILLPELRKSLHLFNTHIDLLASGRKKQILKIRDRISSHAPLTEPLIFCGDFNDWTREIPGWLEPDLYMREAHTVLHGSPAKSFPGFFPVLHLDRIYFRGIKAISCQALQGRPWNRLSDHLPLLAEFELS